MEKIANSVQTAERVLTVLTGDFNFLVEDTRRWCKSIGQWSGASDIEDERQLTAKLANPFGLHDWSQLRHSEGAITNPSLLL